MSEASVLSDPAAGPWRSMNDAPKDRSILVRRHNDVMHEYDVVWWSDFDPAYPWVASFTSYPEGRLDEWMDIPD